MYKKNFDFAERNYFILCHKLINNEILLINKIHKNRTE